MAGSASGQPEPGSSRQNDDSNHGPDVQDLLALAKLRLQQGSTSAAASADAPGGKQSKDQGAHPCTQGALAC